MNFDAFTFNPNDLNNEDPFNFRHPAINRLIKSFNTENPQHPYILNMIYKNDPNTHQYHGLSNTMRSQDVSPISDCLLSYHLFMESINSRNGFTSKENLMCVICPICVFKDKQKFSCRFTKYPSLSLDPASVRSDLKSLPAESYKVEFSVDMFGVKIEIDPEVLLICTPESRAIEFQKRKLQISNSINQTMQEQICIKLAGVPSITESRLRNESPSLKSLLENPENVSDFVYGEIQKEVFEFCSWSLNPVYVNAALEDAYTILESEDLGTGKPEFVVTTPDVASLIADVKSYNTKPTHVLYTVKFASDDGEYIPGDIRPYEGVSKEISLETLAVTVSGRVLPIIQVPHLLSETKRRYNTFEHDVEFKVFNEIGQISKSTNTQVDDFKSVDKTKIRVTDLHLGEDGQFNMDDCLRMGGFLLPQTYDRKEYERMCRMVPGLLQLLLNLNESDLIDLIGNGPLPPNSKFNLFFPSSKVRFRLEQINGEEQIGQFRSTGIFGNRPSFDNWHPPYGDIEAAKDWIAKRMFLNSVDVDKVVDYLKKCSIITWTEQDLSHLYSLLKFTTSEELVDQFNASNVDMIYIVKDLIGNKGFSKFVGMPRFIESLYVIISSLQQNKDKLMEMLRIPEDDIFLYRTITEELQHIILFREKLFMLSKRFLDLCTRIDLPSGLLTECPPSTPILNIPVDNKWKDAENNVDRNIRFTYRFLQLCIYPQVFKYIYSFDTETENLIDFDFENPNKNNTQAKLERFRQPFYPYGFLTNVPPNILCNTHFIQASGNVYVQDVSAYDPLYRFSIDILKDGKYSRSDNFFDHFVSHRCQYLRTLENESNMTRIVAAFLNMVSYTPNVERIMGHKCLMNRKYRIIRSCQLRVAMAGVYRSGYENILYAVGNLSTVTKQTANNGIMVSHRINGNCIIPDPPSCGTLISNAVSKGLVSGMTSTLANIHDNLSSSFRLKQDWYKNLAYVVEALPGRHPVWDQHHIIPLNGRHLFENFNSAGFDITRIDNVAKENGGWYSENMYSLRNYSEAHLIFCDLFPKNNIPLYNRNGNMGYDGLKQLMQRAQMERKQMAGRIVETRTTPTTVFCRNSNIGFLERQLHPCSNNSMLSSDRWLSKSPLKENSCSDTRFVETLHLTRRRTDRGIKVLDEKCEGYNDITAPFLNGLKGMYGTEVPK